jgi:hypothetical protein
MKGTKKVLLGILILLVLIQFIHSPRNRSKDVLPVELTKTFQLPENVKSLLNMACYDCHSNYTAYPWYSRLQPIDWIMTNHIKKGKAVLNFSVFGSYSRRRQISKLKGIAVSIKDGTMPLRSYRLMHGSARLAKEDKATIMDWAIRTKDSLTKYK